MTYRSVCRGIYSSHCGHASRAAYTYSGGDERARGGSWLLWPNLSIEGRAQCQHFPSPCRWGLGNTPCLRVSICTVADADAEQEDAIRYIDERSCRWRTSRWSESVQAACTARDSIRAVHCRRRATDMSEHAVHHFHGLRSTPDQLSAAARIWTEGRVDQLQVSFAPARLLTRGGRDQCGSDHGRRNFRRPAGRRANCRGRAEIRQAFVRDPPARSSRRRS